MLIIGDSTDNGLEGTLENDLMYGGWGNDTLHGNEGDDRLLGQEGIDLLYGDQGNDELYGGLLADTLYGGDGNDTLYGEGSVLVGGADWLDGGVGDDLLYGDDGNDTLYGGDGNDTLSGGTKDDVLEGGAGNDVLNGDAGANQLLGGDGDDSYYVNSAADQVIEAGTGIDSVYTSISLALGNHVERLILLETATTGTGNSLSNGMLGNANANGLNGLDGDDTLNGDAGDDTLQGGNGDDLLIGGSGNDTLTGQAGRDRFVLSQPGLDGIDRITDFNVIEDAITILLGSGYGGDLPINQAISAGQFVNGQTAADADDRFIYDITTGALFFDGDGVGGTEQIQIAQLAPGVALTYSHIITTNSLDLQGEHPTTPSGPIVGSLGNDTLTGTSLNDVIDGKAGHDQLIGLAGHDTLLGGSGQDTLLGGLGNDVLNGGNGSDTYTGGLGRDRFMLAKGPGCDRILDFEDRRDRLCLSGGLTYGQLTLTQQGKNVVISANGDQLALLQGVNVAQLSATDFIRVA